MASNRREKKNKHEESAESIASGGVTEDIAFESISATFEEDSEGIDDAVEGIEADADDSVLDVVEEEVTEEVISYELSPVEEEALRQSELSEFASVEIEEKEFLTTEQVTSIIESLLFATDKPLTVGFMRQAFKGTQIKTADVKVALAQLQVEYANQQRGVSLEEVAGGYQLRTKLDNQRYLRQTVKPRVFKLSPPALEVLGIVAYSQPCTKGQIDEVRGVESGHLLRSLMERGLVTFEGKSELPGRPMFYGTTKKFLEVFGLRNIKELPSIHEIDQLLPEGIEPEVEKPKLSHLTENMSERVGTSYSESEDELFSISEQLSQIHTTTDFFEEEKKRQKAEAEAQKAQTIRDSLILGEEVAEKDKRWLERYEAKLLGEDVRSAEETMPVETAPPPAETPATEESL